MKKTPPELRVRRPLMKGKTMEDLRDKTLEELRDWFAGMGEKPFRANQLFRWIARGATAFETLTDMPLALRTKMEDLGTLQNMSLLECQVAGDGTRKYLFRLADGQHRGYCPYAGNDCPAVPLFSGFKMHPVAEKHQSGC